MFSVRRGVKAWGTWAYPRDRSPGEVPARGCAEHSNQKRQDPMTGVECIWTLCPVALQTFPGLASAYPTPSHLVIYMLTVTDAATSMTKLPGPED